MPMQTKTAFGLTGNQLKLIALITMTIDHIGMILLPRYTILRIIGRLAFPIFAYMIAEGCRYTKNKLRYITVLAAMALVCQVCYFVADRSLFQCILVTFSLSVLTVYALDYAITRRSVTGWVLAALTLGGVCFVCIALPRLLPGFDVDYGIFGVLLPVAVYFGRGKAGKLLCAGVLLALVALDSRTIQWFALLALPLLALYNGKRGSLKLKNLFYIYYPLHLAVIWLIRRIILWVRYG